jgi:DNA polymerase-3 subunit alpha
MIGQGFTVGIFQIEKQLGRTWSKNLQPVSIEQLSDLVSIIRPGPMDSGMHTSYRGVKNKGETPAYIHPKLEPIMGRTFSALLYQEQVIEICKQLASMSLSDADSVRKAMGKKKPEEMRKWKEVFISGCTSNDIDVVTAEEIWGYIEKFAGYGFNKSHGVGYALLAYETAYMKANYPVEFLCAKLRHSDSHPDKFEQMSALVYDSKLFNIEVVPPRVTLGNKDFDVVDDTHIAFGLTALKGVGAAAITEVVKIGRQYKSFDDILWAIYSGKSKVTTAVLTALIRGGAFDDLIEHRIEAQARFKLMDALTPNERQLIQTLIPHQEGTPNWIRILRAISDETKASVIKERFKVKIPDTRRRPKIREALQDFDARELFDTKAQRIAWEQFYLGISLSGSEADIYTAKDKCIDLVRSGQPEDNFEIAVCVDTVREHVCTKGKSAGQSMAFVTARDKTYVMDNIVVFPNVFGAIRALLDEGSVLKIKGRIDDRGSLVANKVERLK